LNEHTYKWIKLSERKNCFFFSEKQKRQQSKKSSVFLSGSVLERDKKINKKEDSTTRNFVVGKKQTE